MQLFNEQLCVSSLLLTGLEQVYYNNFFVFNENINKRGTR